MLMKQKIVIIDYGAGNVRSLQCALTRLGYDAIITADQDIIAKADKVIFPGVGHAQSAMQQLRDTELDTLIPRLTMPVLGICLGMQLMCAKTSEGDTQGLGIFDVEVKHLSDETRSSFKIPHMGWNTIESLTGKLFDHVHNHVHCYFVHSYYVPITASTIAVTEYPHRFSAAIAKDNFYGCQFHPEKSGQIGEQILLNFLKL